MPKILVKDALEFEGNDVLGNMNNINSENLYEAL
jgi:hypothetical protein